MIKKTKRIIAPPITDIFTASRTGEKAIMAQLGTRDTGLTASEVVKRHEQYGKNVLVEEQKKNIILQFLGQFKNPLILILLVASAASFSFGERASAFIIAFIILFSTFLNLWQEAKADHAAEKLKERLKNDTTVVRDGKKIDILVSDLAVGDMLDLNAGDLIPADARIILAKDFFVNESTLTGESFPREKYAESMTDKAGSIGELTNIIFSGTNVITGTVKAVVVAVGRQTEFGKIAHHLVQKETDTEFTLGIKSFGHLILRTTLFIVIIIFFLNIVLHRNVFESFMFALAVAVGLTPELLPLILSVNMSVGSLRMARDGVIVKKLVAIPNFGSLDVLCTDKTGTLTEDKIALVKYIDSRGESSDQVLRYAYLNSFFQTGISNPLDQAVVEYKKLDIKTVSKIDEIPFDFSRKRMSIVVDEGRKHRLICKGAPEEIAKVCTMIDLGKSTRTIATADTERLLTEYHTLSADGYRVLGLAYKDVASVKPTYGVPDESDLTFLGFIAFLDPPKASAKEVLKKVQHAGLAIKVITGDNEFVTQKVCAELGMTVHGVLLGKAITNMTDDALAVAVEKHNIFARFSPDQKNRVITALQRNGHIVGYMGDGINDAPSLEAADVGISVENAVDVAKQAADIILTKKDLAVLLDGIFAGRVIFGNSMKYIMMGVSSNFGNMFSVIGAVIFLPFLPMLPIQILLNNLLYDISQMTIPNDNVDPEYIEKPKRWDIGFIKKFMVAFGLTSSLFDFITFAVLYGVWHVSAAAFHTGWFIESLATQTLIILVIRTRKLPFLRSWPAKSLLISTITVVALGWILPFTRLGVWFQFVPLPFLLVATIVAIVLTYLVAVEGMKQWFYRRFAY